MKYFLPFILLLNFNLLISQNQFKVEFDVGYAFQGDTKINNESLGVTDALGLRLGINYQKALYKKIFFEAGLFSKYNRSKNTIENLTFISNSLKLQLPIYISYKLNKNWDLSLGVSIENNKDFSDFELSREYNMRYDFLTKIVYNYTKKLSFSFYTNWAVSELPDYYTISSPKNGIYFGVAYNLFTIKNKNNEE